VRIKETVDATRTVLHELKSQRITSLRRKDWFELKGRRVILYSVVLCATWFLLMCVISLLARFDYKILATLLASLVASAGVVATCVYKLITYWHDKAQDESNNAWQLQKQVVAIKSWIQNKAYRRHPELFVRFVIQLLLGAEPEKLPEFPTKEIDETVHSDGQPIPSGDGQPSNPDEKALPQKPR
jgi:hypothetical protein